MDTIREVTVRIYRGEAATAGDILADQGFEERRLPGPGLADDIHVRQAIRITDAEGPIGLPDVGSGKICDVLSAFFHLTILCARRLSA
jgi:hypothetical protein